MLGWDRDQNSFCLLCHSGPLCWGIPSHDIWSDIKWYGMQNTQTNQMVTGPLAFLKIFIIPCSYFLLQNFTSFDRPTSLIGSSNLLELLRVRTCSCFPKKLKNFQGCCLAWCVFGLACLEAEVLAVDVANASLLAFILRCIQSMSNCPRLNWLLVYIMEGSHQLLKKL